MYVLQRTIFMRMYRKCIGYMYFLVWRWLSPSLPPSPPPSLSLSPSSECEKLIRKMLQLDPSKRIPLSKVLEHKWMQASPSPTDGPSPLRSSSLYPQKTASGNLLWNEQVLLAIQRLNSSNFSIEAVKQVRPHTHVYCTYLLFGDPPKNCNQQILYTGIASMHRTMKN